MKLAREAAGGKDVAVAGGGTMLRHVMQRGLVDELELHIVPVVLGDGQRLFDASLNLADDEGIELTPLRVVESPEVTHLRYAVTGPRTLVLDDRGRRPRVGCRDEVHVADLRQRGEPRVAVPERSSTSSFARPTLSTGGCSSRASSSGRTASPTPSTRWS